jgi:hypothetical protein
MKTFSAIALQAAFAWMLKTVYQDGDEIHILHVVPGIKFQVYKTTHTHTHTYTHSH